MIGEGTIGYLWLVPAFPLLSFVIICLFTRGLPRVSGYVCIASIFLSFLVSCWALLGMLGAQAGAHGEKGHGVLQMNVPWIVLGETHLDLGILLDPLTAVMLIVVTSVSLLVQVYSQGYMHGDSGYSRYFAFMSLFTMSMLSLVLANNFLQLFISWELVGVCSYLLIGFWFHKPEAAAAAKKAFVVTRFGDLGFLVGILMIFAATGMIGFDHVEEAIRGGVIGGATLTVVALLLFSGAVGKSAQFPLHVWLPDAMEGPTPVSALIHAATMVAAGVYMVARLINIFEGSPTAMLTVAFVGGFTAIFAASMGLVMNDIKRVLAYSTVSQLGYMMLALGVGGYVAGVFHLMNHAFFKALLFLGSGSVIHATATQDIREMGGLRKVMPITFVTFTIGSLSLAGIFPLSGFWSKDEILADTLAHGQTILFGMALVGAFMTAFYMFRVIFVAFFGEYRGGPKELAPAAVGHSSGSPSLAGPGRDDGVQMLAAAAASGNATLEIGSDQPSMSVHVSGGHGAAHGVGAVHESPWVMTIPLILLAVPSVLSGLVNMNGDFARFMGAEHVAEMNLSVALSSTAVALFGIFLAWLVYGRQAVSAQSIGRVFGPAYTLVARKYFVDELYQWIVDKVVLGLSNLGAWFDQVVVDGVVNGVAYVVMAAGTVLRRAHTGQLQGYGLVFFAGIFLILATLVLGGR
ncbi:MAG: NADH-quinone oxidoreductase subunit L [Chloroflexota bacterium]